MGEGRILRDLQGRYGECCEGLHEISSGYRNGVIYCTAEVCGNGACRSVENEWNCAEDCGEEEDEKDEEEVPEVEEELLRVCPDMRVENLMPCLCTGDDCSECEDRRYYILDGERRELDEFDNEWVEENCDVEEKVVY